MRQVDLMVDRGFREGVVVGVQVAFEVSGVGARLKLTTCAGLKLTRCYSGVDYYAAVDKSTRL